MKEIIKKFPGSRLQGLTHHDAWLKLALMLALGLMPAVAGAQNIPSGTFQFTTGSYSVSVNEGAAPTDTSLNPSLLGARVTVTRSGGASGRVQVPYSGAASGTLSFDDYQMSASILVPGTGTVTLGAPTLDPLESADLMPPALGGITSEMITVPTAVIDLTNSVINLERATFRVRKTTTNAIIHVMRTANSVSGGQDVGVTVQYAINQALPHPVQSGFGGNPTPGNTFALEAGSDYALPNVNFSNVSGTVTFAANQLDQTITIPILQPGQVEFNLDLQLQIFIPLGSTQPALVGEISKATVTILPDDAIQPAGAVDPTWNKDNSDGFDSNPPYLQFPGTKGGVSDTANGNGGTVYAVVEQPDGKSILAGSFNSYDSNPYNRIVRVLSNGYQDPTFLVAPNSGANDVINAMVLQTDGKIVIGGNFTSFNGYNRYHIARLNSDGSVDTSFNPGLGANDTVWAVNVRSDGKILIGGDFTQVNGVDSSYVARLNSDGSLDTTYPVGNTINGPVYALAIGGASSLNISNNASGGQAEDIQAYSLGAGDAGSIQITYNMLSQPDELRVFYGGTNDYQVYNTGPVSGTNTITVNFGPTNGFSTNVITIVMNLGGGQVGTLWSYTAKLTSFGDNAVYIGGAFDQISGNAAGGVARLNDDGSLDADFATGLGTYDPDFGFTDPVYALALQGGKLLVGGAFSHMELAKYNGLVRLNTDGTVDSTFNPGTGTYNPFTQLTDSIYAITLQADGKILIGGDFTTFNQTRRVGLARLFAYGSVDTSFMDTAYNQFAGLINHYYNPDAINLMDYPQGNHRNFVAAIAVETNSPNNVIIGGSFLRVGGGSVVHSGVYDMPVNSGIFANGRMDIHPRSNVARLIGATTPGPGNISLTYGSYSADKSAGTLYVSISRTNGSLGVISATCSPQYQTAGPGIATTNDFTGGATPTWPTLYSRPPIATRSWMSAPGTFGPNFIFDSTYGAAAPNPDVFFTILNNTNITGNLNAKINLTAPNGTSFALGGEAIPLGAALGYYNLSPLNIIDTNIKPGVFGFSSPTYTVNQGSTATITVTRTGGSDGTVQINYAATNGTAFSPTNYTAVTNTLTFGPGVTTKTFTVPTATGTTTNVDRTVNLRLFGVTSGATIGLTNAVLTIVNNTFTAGHIAFTTPAYVTNENAGTARVTVNRLGGSTGTMDVTAIVGTNGVNYPGSTNALHWNNGDVSVKTLLIPVIHDGVFTPDLILTLRLTNGLANNTANANVLGLSGPNTNATLTIVNVDFPGFVQFATTNYSVKKFAGSALIPVIRTGGSAQTVTVRYFTTNGSATSGVNYTATNGLLTFTNGEVAKYFTVPIIDDGHPDGLLSLGLVLSNATPASAMGSFSNAVLNIIDTASVNEPPGTVDNTYSPFAGFNGNVYALTLQTNKQLIVGGDFTMANSVPRRRLARLNADGSLDASFLLPSSTMGADDQIRALAVQTDRRIIVGGFFTNFNSVAESRITRLNYDGSLDSTFNPGSGADNSVFALAQSPVDGKILVGGAFTRLNGAIYNGIGRLNVDGTPDTSFNSSGAGAGSSGGSSTVYALAVQADGKIIIGGDFTTYNGVTVNHLARLNTDGSLDSAFTTGASANDSVRAIALQLDGKILIGGLFTNYNGIVLNRVARLNTTGTVDGSFTPVLGADDMVSAIALQTDGRIVLGGQFTHCNGVTRNRITRLNPTGTVDPTINFGSGASDFVAALAIQQDTIPGYPANVLDEKIILGGVFTQYNGEPHNHLARIFGGSVSGVGAFEFSAADYQVTETGINAVITVIRTGGASGTNADGSGSVSVPFATSDGSATAGINYSSVFTNLDFPVGEVQRTVLIPVLDDGVITGDLTVNLEVNPVPPAAYGNQPTAVLTILNDDDAIRFATDNYQVAKNVVNGLAAIDIARLGSANSTASVIFSTTTNGTAVIGTDYYPVTNLLVTFAPGVTNVAVTIPIINNNQPTGARTVTMQLSNVVNSVLTSPSNATLTIIDTVNAPGSLSLISSNLTVNEGDTNVVIAVIRTNGHTGIVSVHYTTTPGTAVPGINYTTTSGTLTFGDGVTNKNIVVPLVDNNLVQGPVNFSVTLSAPSGGASLVNPTNANITILDNESGLSFVLATNIVPEDSGSANIAVQRLYNSAGVATVHYATANGTASNGVNYTATSGTLTFTNGETLKSISVPLIDVTNVTGDLQFTISLSAPVTGAQLVAPSNSVVIIQDADAGIHFTNSTMRVLKSAGVAVITVVNSNPRVEPVVFSTNDVPLSVQYYTVDGTAVAGVDYQSTSGTLVFTNGIATNTFTVQIFNNGTVTGDHAFTVVLTNVTAPGQLVPPSTQSVVIVESNAGLRFSQAAYTVFENGLSANINVFRTGYTDSIVSVDFRATNGTATSANFVATNGTLMFTNGVTVRSFVVPIIANSAVQPNLTVLLGLFNPTNGYLVPPSSAVLTILENGGSFVVPAGSQLISEAGAGAPNGIIDSNETVQVLFAFRDSAGLNVTNLIAYLLATNGVFAPSPASQTYGPLTVYGHSVSRPFTFTAHGTNSFTITPTFNLYDNAKFIGTAAFVYSIGSWTTSFTNTNSILILDNTNASPYPSVINVSGVGKTLLKATVTLDKLSHKTPGDIDALVVSPAGTNTLIMAHAGGVFSVTNIVLTFDDAVTNTLPQNARMSTGTNKPTQFYPVKNFP